MIDGRSSRGCQRRDREGCERNIAEGILFSILRKKVRKKETPHAQKKVYERSGIKEQEVSVP